MYGPLRAKIVLVRLVPSDATVESVVVLRKPFLRGGLEQRRSVFLFIGGRRKRLVAHRGGRASDRSRAGWFDLRSCRLWAMFLVQWAIEILLQDTPFDKPLPSRVEGLGASGLPGRLLIMPVKLIRRIAEGGYSFFEVVTVLAGSLGMVHGLIGDFDQAVVVGAVKRINRNSDARGDGDFRAVRFQRVRDRRQNFVRNDAGFLRSGNPRKQNQELVAADAGDGIAVA